MTFGDRLKQYRLDNDLSLRELAEKLGTTKQALSLYERGERSPNIKIANEYATKLGIPLENFIDSNVGLYDGVKNAPTTNRDKSIETIMALFKKLDNDQKLEVIMFAANLIGNNENKLTDFPSSTGQSE